MSRARQSSLGRPERRRPEPRIRAALLAALAALGLAAPAAALTGAYRVSAFRIEYALDHPQHIPVDDLLDLEVGLRSRGDTYVAPRPVDRTVRMRLRSLPRNASFSATAIQHINQHIVSTFNRHGINGVVVTVPQIAEGSGADLRRGGDTELVLRIWTGRVSRVTSIADGARFGSLSVDERTNLAAHEWIRNRSPVRPGGERGLLRVARLDDYASLLSRHPGRRVDVQLEPGAAPGTTAVNLRIAEAKPWYVYSQYTNTGTEATTKNRERFGFVHNQLLGRDDVFQLDYTTGDFESPHSVLGSYEAPFLVDVPEWRWRLRGWWSEFDASEVGFSDGRFVGRQAAGDLEVSWNAYQDGDFFLDLVAGGRAQQMAVRNFQFDDRARALFYLGRAGVAGRRDTRTSTLRFSANVEAGFTDANQRDLAILGNEDPADGFVTLQWDGSVSFYLEPLFDRQAWEDPSTPGSSTLAHEVAALFRGQYAFENRLVPQYQQIAGGLYTVRGYPQASAVGDDLLLGSLEYRLHVPRLFSPDATPPEVPGMGEFRARPQYVWGRPDWDFVVRLFADAARTSFSRRNDTEQDQNLLSVGAGVELSLLRNLSLRVDYGHALTGAGDVRAGHSETHLVGTLLY